MACPLDRKSRLNEYEKSLKQILIQLLTIQEQIKKERECSNNINRNANNRSPTRACPLPKPQRNEIQKALACRVPNSNPSPPPYACPANRNQLRPPPKNNGRSASLGPTNHRGMSPNRESKQVPRPNRDQMNSNQKNDKPNTDRYGLSSCQVQLRTDPCGNQVRESQSITVLPKNGRFQRMIAIKENPDGTMSRMYVIRKEYLPNNQDTEKQSCPLQSAGGSNDGCPYKPERSPKKPTSCKPCPRKQPKNASDIPNDKDGIQMYPARNLNYDESGVASIGSCKMLKKSISCDNDKADDNSENESCEESIGHDPFLALQRLIARYEDPPKNHLAANKCQQNQIKRPEIPDNGDNCALEKDGKKPSQVEVESYKMINEIVNTTICIFATVNCAMKSDPIKNVSALPKDVNEVKELIVESLKKSEEYRLIIQTGMQKMLREMESRSKLFAPHLHCLYMERVKEIKDIADDSISEMQCPAKKPEPITCDLNTNSVILIESQTEPIAIDSTEVQPTTGPKAIDSSEKQ